jgi:hypothetical protein
LHQIHLVLLREIYLRMFLKILKRRLSKFGLIFFFKCCGWVCYRCLSLLKTRIILLRSTQVSWWFTVLQNSLSPTKMLSLWSDILFCLCPVFFWMLMSCSVDKQKESNSPRLYLMLTVSWLDFNLFRTSRKQDCCCILHLVSW